jgi:hypothetical protein
MTPTGTTLIQNFVKIGQLDQTFKVETEGLTQTASWSHKPAIYLKQRM